MFSELYEQMNKTYGHIHFWPQPYQYSEWHAQLTLEYQPYYLKPLDYCALYQYSVKKYQTDLNALKPKKISRNQKRKIKKKQLEEELEQ